MVNLFQDMKKVFLARPSVVTPRAFSERIMIGLLVSGAAVGSGCGYVSSGGEYSIREGLEGDAPIRVASTKTKVPSYADQLKNLPASERKQSPNGSIRSDDLLASNTVPTAPSSQSALPSAAGLTNSSLPVAGSSTAASSLARTSIPSARRVEPFEVSQRDTITTAAGKESADSGLGRAKLATPFDPSSETAEKLSAPVRSANSVDLPPAKEKKFGEEFEADVAESLSAVDRKTDSEKSPSKSTETAKVVTAPSVSTEKKSSAQLNDITRTESKKPIVSDELAEIEKQERAVRESGLPAARTEVADDEGAVTDGTDEVGTDVASTVESTSAKSTDLTSAKAAVATEKTVVTEKKGVSPSVTTTAAKANAPTGDCAKAEAEAARARSSVSEADQLFYFRRALRLCSTSTQYHMEIGKIYSALGRKEDAEFEFKQVLDLDPKNQEAKALLSGKN